mgnify:CR=1 FL=1|jgi:hypothetical protein
MITIDLLEKKWNSITYYDGGFLRLDTNHPLEWFIGYQSINQKTLIIISSHEIIAPTSSKSVLVSSRRREIDEKWALSFELMRNEQESVFINLCCDIINYSQHADNEKESIALILSRYKQWNRLLESQKKNLIDENSKKGLIGELIFLKSKIKEGINILTVIQAWVGPGGADQDFIFRDKWCEIKTIGISSELVTISSIEQLDCSEEGCLVIIRVDKTAPERPNSFSLYKLVNDIRDLIEYDISAKIIFEEKLLNSGYIDTLEYDNQKYYYSGMKYYLVNSTFPRIKKEQLSNQIVECHYAISIAGISDWEVLEE